MAAVFISCRRGWRAVTSTNNQVRKMSVNGRRDDTTDLMRTLKEGDIPSNQAEAITSVISKFVNDTMENVSRKFVSNEQINKQIKMSEKAQDVKFLNLKSELQSSKEHHFSFLQQEIEKLWVDIEEKHRQNRCLIDMSNARQHGDLNLERAYIRDMLARHCIGISDLTKKLYQEIHTSRTQFEDAKFEVTKYFVFTCAWLCVVSVIFFGKNI